MSPSGSEAGVSGSHPCVRTCRLNLFIVVRLQPANCSKPIVLVRTDGLGRIPASMRVHRSTVQTGGGSSSRTMRGALPGRVNLRCWILRASSLPGRERLKGWVECRVTKRVRTGTAGRRCRPMWCRERFAGRRPAGFKSLKKRMKCGMMAVRSSGHHALLAHVISTALISNENRYCNSTERGV